ncbi:glycosaminoglycan xylosylkinase-like [Branchiostoma floridae]|uniref:Glycosaminoglycan xylosylkinase-like n=1 Tax=Branchiostoma floridae TaxID=7739 RepID=A0A9J7LM65_BRAFL|nr:glycosaminoglycan xylosylkinase-like [Branchiostoma floridae]
MSMGLKLKQRFVLLAIVVVLALVILYILAGRSNAHGKDKTWLQRKQQKEEHIALSSNLLLDGLMLDKREPGRNHVQKGGLAGFEEIDFTADLGGRSPWTIAASWVSSRHIYPEDAEELGGILRAMATAEITHADVGYKGTQLKALLVLNGHQKAVFKPKRYPREYIIEGKPYDGYDRHNAEIAAFHLDRLLGFRRAPLVVGRKVDLRTEIMPVGSERLMSTFLTQGNNTCFYGKCYYCKETEPACADGEVMEGSVTLWLPSNWSLKGRQRHPWGRTYRNDKQARWEYDDTYCNSVKQTPPYSSGPRLLDILDAAIFDYLIGNADRHHYETFEKDGDKGMLLLLDNAKSFGNPNYDERTILAPIYQCCKLRSSTWERMKLLTGDRLSQLLQKSLSHDPIAPILSDAHLAAMDRRLLTTIDMVQGCIDENGRDNVLVDDSRYH